MEDLGVVMLRIFESVKKWLAKRTMLRIFESVKKWLAKRTFLELAAP